MKRWHLPAGDAGYSACGEDTQDADLSSPPGRGCPSAALSYLASPHRMDSGRAGRGAGGTRITRETRWAVGEVGTAESMEKEDREEKTPGSLVVMRSSVLTSLTHRHGEGVSRATLTGARRGQSWVALPWLTPLHPSPPGQIH